MNNYLYTQLTDFEQSPSLAALAARLNPQTQYCFRVVAYTFSPYIYVGESSEVCTTTLDDVTPPATPEYINAIADPTPEVSLAWPDALDDAWVEKYRLYRDGDYYLGDSSNLTFIDTTIDASTLYCYQVAAVDKAGNESPKSYKICVSAAWSTALEDIGAALGTSAITGNTSLALDSSDGPHITYFNAPNLIYATKDTGDWTKTVIDADTSSAGGASIALDVSGKAHISYGSAGETALKYATNASGIWAITTVDTFWVGTYSSIAVDLSGKAHISYYDYQNGNLKYATNTTGLWVSTVIDDSDNVGRFTSIAADSTGSVHISYYDAQNKILKYATNAGGFWAMTDVDNAGMVGSYTSIALDSSDKAHISYYDETNRTPKYATNKSGIWTVTAVHAGTPSGTGWMTSLSLDTYGKVHMSYNDWGYENLRYATNASGAWKTYVIGPATSGASAVKIDSSGNIHFSSHQGTDIVYAIFNFN
jgi:hypothetical protein